MTFDDFIAENLDPDRVVFDCTEVEEIARKAWVAALENVRASMLTQKLRLDAQIDQEHARFENTWPHSSTGRASDS